MIVGLRGVIEDLQATFLELNVGGVIYGLGVSINTSAKLSEQRNSGAMVLVYCTQIIREDSHLLFGFADRIERLSFERLIKINGVGPKVALAILSTYTPQEFAEILQNKDIAALQRVPGIGAKGAGKIMVDLAGFFDGLIAQKDSPNIAHNETKEAVSALESLGFKSADIASVLKAMDTQNMQVAQIVKEALKLLGKNKIS